MSRLGSENVRGLKRLEVLIGNRTFTLGAGTYPCVPSFMRRGTTIIRGGMEVEIELTLIVRKELFNEAPKAGVNKLTYDNTTYRVLNVGTSPNGSHYELDVGDKNK